MTCIVGIAHNGTVTLGYDSAGVSGWTTVARADPKGWHQDGWLYGIAGSYRVGQIVRHAFKRPPNGNTDDLAGYMTTDFVDAYRQTLKEHGALKTDNGVETARDDARLLVAAHGRLFTIYEDFQVEEVTDNFTAIGSGDELALGSLYATRRSSNVRRRVVTALEAAERYNMGVRGPFTVLEA